MDARQTEVLAPELLTHKQYVYIMTLFCLQHAQGMLSEDEFFMLIDSLRAHDLEGDGWIYHAPLGKWFCVDGEEWAEGTPRGPLLVALPASIVEEFNACLQELEELERRVTAESEEPTGSAEGAPAACASCGAELDEDARFCDQCGAARTAPQPPRPTCLECGAELKGDARFCDQCGAEQRPPAATAPPAAPKTEYAAIAPHPSAVPPRCPGCGAAVHPGLAYCTNCGAPLSAMPAGSVLVARCASCGSPLKAGLAFCTACGARIQRRS